MNEFILDTDSFTLVQRKHPRMLASVATHHSAGHPIGLTVVTVEEQCLGWFSRFRTARDRAQLADASRGFAEAVSL